MAFDSLGWDGMGWGRIIESCIGLLWPID
jgi:hypothetical protein